MDFPSVYWRRIEGFCNEIDVSFFLKKKKNLYNLLLSRIAAGGLRLKNLYLSREPKLQRKVIKWDLSSGDGSCYLYATHFVQNWKNILFQPFWYLDSPKFIIYFSLKCKARLSYISFCPCGITFSINLSFVCLSRSLDRWKWGMAWSHSMVAFFLAVFYLSFSAFPIFT